MMCFYFRTQLIKFSWNRCSHIFHVFVSQTRISHEKYMYGIFMSAFCIHCTDIRAISSAKWMKATCMTDKMDNMDQSEPEEEQPSPDGVRLESILFWCHNKLSPNEKSRIIRLLDNASLGLVVTRPNILVYYVPGFTSTFLPNISHHNASHNQSGWNWFYVV
jgi:hypothetical protein